MIVKPPLASSRLDARMNQHERLGARLDQATVDIAALHPLLKLFLATRVVPPGPDLQQNRRSNQTHQVHTHFRVRRVRFVHLHVPRSPFSFFFLTGA